MSPLLKDDLRDIKDSLPRFLSIVAIILLGVAFFVGIKSASPTMLETANDYYQRYHLPDGRLLSTNGLQVEDQQLLEEEGYEALALKSVDTEIIGSQEIVRLFTHRPDDRHFYEVMEVHLPENSHQIALDAELKDSLGGFEIGDTLQVKQLAQSEDLKELFEEEGIEANELVHGSPQLAHQELEVVGVCEHASLFHTQGARLEKRWQVLSEWFWCGSW